jgi:predicted RNase H-like HicB family nuclease
MVTFKSSTGSAFTLGARSFPAVIRTGRTAEALANLKDAVRLYLDDVMEESLLPTADDK